MKARWIGLIILLMLIGLIKFVNAKPENLLDDQEAIFLYIYENSSQELLYINDFFFTYLTQDEKVYLPVKKLFSNIFEYPVDCNKNLSNCQVISQPKGYELVIDLEKKQAKSIVSNNSKVIYLKKDDAFEKEGDIWISLDLAEQVIPAYFKWDVQLYRLSISTSTELPILKLITKNRHKKQKEAILRQKLAEKDQALLEQARRSDTFFNSETQYRVGLQGNVETSTGQNQYSNSEFIALNSNSKIWRGNLIVTGTMNRQSDADPRYDRDFSGVYSLDDEPYFHQLAFGDVTTSPTLFFNTISLRNGVKFDRLGDYNPTLQFYYEGFSLPDTEIEVWRNGFLVRIFFVDSSGRYIIEDPDAAPGDTYTLKFYYPNGDYSEEVIPFIPNAGVLGKGEFDVETTYGAYDTTGTYSGETISQGLTRYGLTKRITLGLGYMYLPKRQGDQVGGDIEDEQFIPYLELATQPFDTISLIGAFTLDHQGYAFQATSISIPKNIAQIYYHNFAANNPVLTDIIPSIDEQRLLQLTNTYFIYNNWRIFGQYQNEPGTTTINADLITDIYRYFSPKIGYQRTTTENSGFTQSLTFQNGFAITQEFSLLFQGSTNFQGSNSQSLIGSYRYKQYLTFNVSGTRNLSSSGDVYTYSLGMNWNPTPNWILNLSLSKDQGSLSISYIDVLGLFSSPQLPSDFGSGTIYGTLMSPETDFEPSYPLEGVRITAGNKSTFTDEKGQFNLSGLPSNQPIFVKFDKNTLNPMFISKQDKIPVYLKSTDILELNPEFVLSVGFEGTLYSNKALPNEVELRVTSLNNPMFDEVIPVDPEGGFFMLSGIAPGKYQLELIRVENPPKPIEIEITEKEEWKYDVSLFWQQN